MKPTLLPPFVAIQETEEPRRVFIYPRADAARYLANGSATYVPLPPWTELQAASDAWWEANKGRITAKKG